MAVTKEKKGQLIEKYVELLEKSNAAVFLHVARVGVNDITRLRAKMREVGSNYSVVKNTLFKRALEQMGKPTSDVLNGPVSVVFCSEDIAATVKAVNEFGNTVGNGEFKIVGGIIGREALNDKGAKALAEMPSREVLFARILGGIQAPASQLAGVITSGVRQIVTVLQARVDQLKEGEAVEAA